MLVLALGILGYAVALATVLCAIAALTRGPAQPTDSTNGRQE